MEINQPLFYPRLLGVLRSLADAPYVAIDLEMSGIAVRDGPRRPSELSLDEQYAETKAAAEKYTVLQVGITCISPDPKRSMYITKPYNFNVSPLLLQEDKLGVYRDTTLSSSAMHFLQRNSFKIGDVYSTGVPYLSRSEEETALRRYHQSANAMKTLPDIILRPDDNEARSFVRSTRNEVKDWMNKKEPEGYLNIGGTVGLSSFQRRLVHQLVRKEFPAHRVFTRCGGEFMQMERLDLANEALIQAKKLSQFNGMLAKQKGLSWIFEALVGGDLSGLNHEWFQVDEDGFPKLSDPSAIKAEIASLQEAFKSNQRILVGHNLFTDLAFLTKAFVGSLPDSLKDFRQTIHDLFPLIIDTKFMATKSGGMKRDNSSLEGLYHSFNSQRLPQICLEQKHVSYDAAGKSRSHEAGYDSWMTAQLFLKLAAKLNVGTGADTSNRLEAQALYVKSTEMSQLINDQDSDGSVLGYYTADEGDFDGSDDGVPLNPPDTNFADLIPALVHKDALKRPHSGSVTPTRSKFSSSNLFANLNDEANGHEDDSDEGGAEIHLKAAEPTMESRGRARNSGSQSIMDERISEMLTIPGLADSPDRSSRITRTLNAVSSVASKAGDYRLNFAQLQGPICGVLHERSNGTGHNESQELSNEIQQWIPEQSAPFWGQYINKLRVYGTTEQVLSLEDRA